MAGDKTAIEVAGDVRLIREFWKAYGLILALEALKEAPESAKGAAGFALAQALVAAAAANQKIDLQRNIMRAAAAAGHDLGAVNIRTEWRGSTPFLEVEPITPELDL